MFDGSRDKQHLRHRDASRAVAIIQVRSRNGEGKWIKNGQIDRRDRRGEVESAAKESVRIDTLYSSVEKKEKKKEKKERKPRHAPSFA